MGKCSIVQDGNELVLSFPYDPAMVADLKSSIPASDRRYDPAKRVWRAPLRCGLIMCEGVELLGVFNVTRIFAWEDVRDSFGRVLVVSWPKGANMFEEVWS